MKRLELVLNIGTGDAKRLALDATQAGEVVSVDDAVADELLRKGWAAEPKPKKTGRAAAAEAVPTPAPAAAPEVVAVEPPDFDAMTKEELKAHADVHGIEGVTMAQSKDDMVRTVKRASRAR